MTELKPCPFCGAAASAWEWNGGARVDCSKWRADAYSVYTHYVGIGARTMEEAIELWNRRAEQPPAQPEQRWISCDKGEPDEDMECWVTVKTTDTLYRGNFTKRYGERRDKGFITSGGFMWWNTALAWMPIYEPEPYRPEPYKEEQP